VVIVYQHVTTWDQLEAFIASWRPHAAQTYDPQAGMPPSCPFEVFCSQDDVPTAKVSCWLEPR
jgi:hypothetical protein